MTGDAKVVNSVVDWVDEKVDSWDDRSVVERVALWAVKTAVYSVALSVVSMALSTAEHSAACSEASKVGSWVVTMDASTVVPKELMLVVMKAVMKVVCLVDMKEAKRDAGKAACLASGWVVR